MLYPAAAVLLNLLFFFLSPVVGEETYNKYCASCHHPQKIGITAPPLLPMTLSKYTDEELTKIIKNGLSSTQMPSFGNLKDEEIKSIIRFLREDIPINWSIKEIRSSLTLNNNIQKKVLNIKNIKNITFVVERGHNKIWIMENEDILDAFDFSNVHGGIKYTLDGKNFYIPSRDGWIGYYKINNKKEGYYVGKIRACINLRNISLSKNGNYLIVSCLLPQTLEILNAKTLEPIKEIQLDGKISAIYELYKSDKAIFTFRDKPIIGILNTKDLSINYIKAEEPIEDFFIDPFDKFLIGTSRKDKKLVVYELEKFKLVFEDKMDSMPHLFSAAFWYKNGKFYFATPHIGKPYISIWQMYDWKFIKNVEIGSPGFFVKTHPSTDYLWVDNGSDAVVLINKNDFSEKFMTIVKGKKFTHTEFNGNGNIAYLSIYDNDGYLILYDTKKLQEIKRYPASYPVGKYNFVNKERSFYPSLFGEEIFKEKCWGCHHQTQEAFGPSFKYIANNRTESQIIAQILDPKNSYKLLGYKRNSMPAFNFNEYEIESIVNYIKSFREDKNDRRNLPSS